MLGDMRGAAAMLQRRPLGVLRRSLVARPPPGVLQQLGRAQSSTVARAAATQQDLQRDLSYVVDRPWVEEAPSPAPPGAEAAAAPASGFRQLPINYAPETQYTVDDVAAADARRFSLHSSVDFWAGFATRFSSRSMQEPGPPTSADQLNRLTATVRELVVGSALADVEGASYWAYHLGRTGFFLGASASGAIAHHLKTQLDALASASPAGRTPFQNLAANASSEIANRLLEALAMYSQDLESIRSRTYKLPWDMTTPSHRQFNPLFVLSKSAEFVREAVATLSLRVAAAPGDNWFRTSLNYPEYFTANTFHYQPDGWFSAGSASAYEFSTEALFFGRQDAMQRTSLLPLHDYIVGGGRDPAGLTLLEVGCGTGRFHTFVKDNYPTLTTIASDLSPFYLATARDNVRYWKQQRAPAMALGGPDGTGTTYMQAPMEAFGSLLPDASVDVILSVYAFHEMPEEARMAAAAEWHRLLKPGGLVVFTDSVQLGDRPEWDRTLGAFGAFNEPHYRNYIACDLGSLFADAGFAPGTKYVSSASKTLSFTKPAADGGADAAAASGSNGSGNGASSSNSASSSNGANGNGAAELN